MRTGAAERHGRAGGGLRTARMTSVSRGVVVGFGFARRGGRRGGRGCTTRGAWASLVGRARAPIPQLFTLSGSRPRARRLGLNPTRLAAAARAAPSRRLGSFHGKR